MSLYQFGFVIFKVYAEEVGRRLAEELDEKTTPIAIRRQHMEQRVQTSEYRVI